MILPAFIDETGGMKGPINEEPVFGVGLLILNDSASITDAFYKLHFNFVSDRRSKRNELIRLIRAESRQPTLAELNQLLWVTRHYEYKFTEIAQHNKQQYIDLLNLYFSLDSPEFHAVILDRNNAECSLVKWGGDQWTAYVTLMKQLLRRRLKTDVFAIVDLQQSPAKSPVYVEHELCRISHVKGCLRATSETSVFLQLVDILLGCVQFDWKDRRGYYGTTSDRARAKRDVTDFVKARLALQANAPILTDARNFRRTTSPSLFTAWKLFPQE